MSSKRGGEIFQRVMQVAAILLLAGILGMVVHKGYTDVSALAKEHRGDGFWAAFARYVFKNLAGG